MTDLKKSMGLLDRALFGAHGPLTPALLLAVIIAYVAGFAILYPLAQASASKSAAEGNDPMLHMGP